MDITINSPKTGTADEDGKITPRSITVGYDFGKDVEEAIQLFTAEVVHSKFVAQCSTDLGNSCRRILNEPENGEQEVLEFVVKYKPGVVVKGGGRKKTLSVPELVAELKNPETTNERKIAIKATLQAKIDEASEAKAALRAG